MNVLKNLPAYPISWSRIKADVLLGLEWGQRPTSHSAYHAAEIGSGSGFLNKWSTGGATKTECVEWVKRGYKADALKIKHPSPYDQKKKVRWNDWDGDPDLGRALAGFDKYFYGQTKRVSKPAMTVNFEYYFSGDLPHSTVQEFGSWLAQLFTALEQRGYSLAVNAVAGINRDNPRRVELRVKNHGERSDYTEWSSIFSPIGYRIIMFTAIIRACEEAGARANSGLGGPFSSSPGVDYDKETRTLSITAGNQRFNKDRMDALLKETGLI
jgi:hypothetical protein